MLRMAGVLAPSRLSPKRGHLQRVLPPLNEAASSDAARAQGRRRFSGGAFAARARFEADQALGETRGGVRALKIAAAQRLEAERERFLEAGRRRLSVTRAAASGPGCAGVGHGRLLHSGVRGRCRFFPGEKPGRAGTPVLFASQEEGRRGQSRRPRGYLFASWGVEELLAPGAPSRRRAGRSNRSRLAPLALSLGARGASSEPGRGGFNPRRHSR